MCIYSEAMDMLLNGKQIAVWVRGTGKSLQRRGTGNKKVQGPLKQE